MDAVIRPVTDEEFPAFCRTLETAFGHHCSDEEVADWRSITELDRTLGAFDDGRIVGTAAAITFELSLPGGVTVPAAGVTAVGVRPTHHRRGLLRALMEHQLDDLAAAHEPVAILTASESIIYGRFGYGAATSQVSLAIDPRSSAFAQPIDDSGRLGIAEPPDVAASAPAIHDRARLSQPGDVNRSREWWDLTIRDPDWMHKDESKLFWALHYAATGEPDGYVSYRIKQAWREGLADNEVKVEELVGLEVTTEAALWRYILDLDLTTQVVVPSRPVDEALRWRLADPRRLRTTAMFDNTWARLLDIPVALGARRYGRELEIVFEVRDVFRPSLDGRYLLRAGVDGAECTRTARPADLSLGVADLGTAYLGHPRFATLARAGRVVEHTPGALCLADQAFASDPVPFCRTDF